MRQLTASFLEGRKSSRPDITVVKTKPPLGVIASDAKFHIICALLGNCLVLHLSVRHSGVSGAPQAPAANQSRLQQSSQSQPQQRGDISAADLASVLRYPFCYLKEFDPQQTPKIH